jgi:hypothetical protein
MKVIKYNLLGVLLLFVTVAFSQKRTQKSSELFKVNNNVIVEIKANYSDVTVEYWTKNEVLVETVLEINDVTVEEAKEYFDGWKVEALGNKNKVVVTSRPNFSHGDFDFDFNFNTDFEFDFNFEPVIAYGLEFDSVSFPSPPEMPKIVLKHLNKIKWDQKAYNKDKEKYLKKFEQQQRVWAEEFEKNFEPQLEDFEKKMEKWKEEFAEKYEPQMDAYEKEMEVWEENFEKNIEPQLKKYEEKMALKEKDLEVKLKKMEMEMEKKRAKSMKMKKKILIKIPKNARVREHTYKSSIVLPDDVKKIF